MEPLAKRPRSDFEGAADDLDPRRAKLTDNKDAGQQSLSSAGKPKPCMKYFSTSGCPFGESCHFTHHIPGGLSSLGLAPVVSLSASAASAPQKKAADPGSVTVNGYKTKLCNQFNTATGCRFGARCHFAHGESDLRPSSNMPRGNSRRPIVNGPMGAPPGFSNQNSHYSNSAGHAAPAGNGSGFHPQGYTQPPPQGYTQPPPQGYTQPNLSGAAGNNSQFPHSAGYQAPQWNGSGLPSQNYPQPNQNSVSANGGPVTYSSGQTTENVPVY